VCCGEGKKKSVPYVGNFGEVNLIAKKRTHVKSSLGGKEGCAVSEKSTLEKKKKAFY